MLLQTLKTANNSFTGLKPNKPVTIKRLQKMLPQKLSKQQIKKLISEINSISPKAVTSKVSGKKDHQQTVYQINITTDNLYNLRSFTIPSLKDSHAKGQFTIHLETGELAKGKQNDYRQDGQIKAGDCYGRIYLQRQLNQPTVIQLMPHCFAEGLEQSVAQKKVNNKNRTSYLLQASSGYLISFKNLNRKKSSSVIELSLIKASDSSLTHLKPFRKNDLNKQLISCKIAKNLAQGLRHPDEVVFFGKQK
jgi:hypothetical protein